MHTNQKQISPLRQKDFMQEKHSIPIYSNDKYSKYYSQKSSQSPPEHKS
jgi:hypothetical protein